MAGYRRVCRIRSFVWKQILIYSPTAGGFAVTRPNVSSHGIMSHHCVESHYRWHSVVCAGGYRSCLTLVPSVTR
jgi:hypothetical protein